MTTNITHSLEQEAAIRFFKKKYNAQHGTTFTNNQFADFKVKDLFDHMVELMNQERDTIEIIEAIKSATTIQKEAVRATLGISAP